MLQAQLTKSQIAEAEIKRNLNSSRKEKPQPNERRILR
jgi:hypothetical protein